jgi:hypothetical protein
MATYFETTGISVGTGETDLQTFDISNNVSLGVRVSNTGSNAFNDFNIYCKFHANDPAWTLLYTSSTDYTTPVGFLQAASGDLTALSAGSSGWFTMDVVDFHNVKITGQGTGSTTATVRGVAK